MDSDVLELGGNINLSGFGAVEPGQMVVIKKIVGNFTKKISEEFDNFEKILISLEGADKKGTKMKSLLVIGGKEFQGEVNNPNLFFALNDVLEEVAGKVKKK